MKGQKIRREEEEGQKKTEFPFFSSLWHAAIINKTVNWHQLAWSFISILQKGTLSSFFLWVVTRVQDSIFYRICLKPIAKSIALPIDDVFLGHKAAKQVFVFIKIQFTI